jgi:signal transduction histidine kinase
LVVVVGPSVAGDRRQLEFTTDASHELGTPLSVILAETDLALASPREAANYRGTLVRIRGQSERLRRLVEDNAEPALPNAPPEWIDRLGGVLLDNACRYAGPASRVRVGVALTGSRVTLTVEDSGPGIPADQRHRLSDRFSRATEQGSGTGYQGLGDPVHRRPLGSRGLLAARTAVPDRPGQRLLGCPC